MCVYICDHHYLHIGLLLQGTGRLDIAVVAAAALRFELHPRKPEKH